jgi:predicted HNH restriction endonuclease
MRERGSAAHATNYSVCLGPEMYSEVWPISAARREALSAVFFAKQGRFKRWSTIKGPRPALAPFEVGEEKLFEGNERSVTATIYERNPAARKRCIDHHGPICCICGLDFAAAYGEIAKGFIHVHHVKPLSEIGERYSVDPIRDLVPVCPNCHAVIHLGQKTRCIDEVKKMMDMIKNAKPVKR